MALLRLTFLLARRELRACLFTLVTVGALMSLAPSATAHSDIDSITPANGQSVEQAPTEVVLTFSANVLPEFTQVQVKGGDTLLSLAPPIAKDNVVRQPLPAGLPAALYTVAYRIVSADSHPISGQSTFTVTVGGTPTSVTSSTSGGTSATSPMVPGVSGSVPAIPESGSSQASPSAAASGVRPGTPTAEGTSATPWGLGILAALLAIAALAWLVARRRRRSV